MPDHHTEIERKFYLKKPPAFIHTLEPVRIRQGYLAIEKEGHEVRIREKAGKFILTVKSEGGLQRTEVEIAISENDFHQLWPLTENRRVVKERFIYTEQGYAVEIDRYQEKLSGLYTAEIEFSSRAEADAFVAPEWMGVEVTHQPSFKNKHLATVSDLKTMIDLL